jgi:hypothetical protein
MSSILPRKSIVAAASKKTKMSFSIALKRSLQSLANGVVVY